MPRFGLEIRRGPAAGRLGLWVGDAHNAKSRRNRTMPDAAPIMGRRCPAVPRCPVVSCGRVPSYDKMPFPGSARHYGSAVTTMPTVAAGLWPALATTLSVAACSIRP